MARHLRDLGHSAEHTYLAWCREVGVDASLEKSATQRQYEVELLAQRKAAAAARVRLHHNPRKFLENICAGHIEPGEVTRPGWHDVAVAISRSPKDGEARESLAAFLLHLERHSDLVFGSARVGHQNTLYMDALLHLHRRRGQWLRDPFAWRASSHNVSKQFSSLLRHLLAHYEVPAFMDTAWLRGDKGAYRFRDWFIHIALGKNIRTAKTPYPLTKMIAHHFIQAPDNASIEGALMIADVKALGGSARLALALMATRLGATLEGDAERRAFWLSVYRFFIANPMLDLRHAGPIVDFLFFQKFETQEVLVGPGQVEVRQPPQPNLSMARRTAEALLRQVEAWHGDLRKHSSKEQRFWKSSGIRGLTLRTGPKDDPAQQTFWTLRELLSSQELQDEGRRLKHCVASYVGSCAAGRCSIWSMQRRYGDEERVEPVLTIEVDGKGVVTQARGRANRWPTPQENSVLQTWMSGAGLKPGPYLGGW